MLPDLLLDCTSHHGFRNLKQTDIIQTNFAIEIKDNDEINERMTETEHRLFIRPSSILNQ